MDFPVFLIPGIGNSDARHWQSLWQSAHPDWQRLEVDDWDQVHCDAWVAAIDRQAAALGHSTLIVAHSLGCLAAAHWAAQRTRAPAIRGALLVAVPDPKSPVFPSASATGFASLPISPLPFSCVIAASANDPYASLEYARACADTWGAQLVEMGAKGHLNSSSGLGEWPEGYRLLRSLAEQ